MNRDFLHKKVIPFDNYLTINFNYNDVDIILKGLELLCYNLKNVYLMKEDSYAVRDKTHKISLLYNLILSNYTLHIDNQLKLKEENETKTKNDNYRFKIDTRQLRKVLNARKEVEKVG